MVEPALVTTRVEVESVESVVGTRISTLATTALLWLAATETAMPTE